MSNDKQDVGSSVRATGTPCRSYRCDTAANTSRGCLWSTQASPSPNPEGWWTRRTGRGSKGVRGSDETGRLLSPPRYDVSGDFPYSMCPSVLGKRAAWPVLCESLCDPRCIMVEKKEAFFLLRSDVRPFFFPLFLSVGVPITRRSRTCTVRLSKKLGAVCERVRYRAVHTVL